MWLNRIWTSLQDAISVCWCCLCQSHLQKGLHNIMSQGAPGPHLPIRAATPSPLHHLLLLYIFLWDVLQVKSVLLAENRSWTEGFCSCKTREACQNLSQSFLPQLIHLDTPLHKYYRKKKSKETCGAGYVFFRQKTKIQSDMVIVRE